MSGECNVCGQEHAEIHHCPFARRIAKLEAVAEAARSYREGKIGSEIMLDIALAALEAEDD